MRLSIALDAENQVDPGLRERVVKARTYGAQMIAAQRVIAQ